MKKTTKKHATKQHEIKEDSSKTNSLLLTILVAISVVQLLLVAGLYFKGSSDDSETIETLSEKVERIDSFFANNVPGYGDDSLPSDTDSDSDSELAEISIDGEPMMGDENAAVTIVEFTDYECPFCKRYVDETYEQIKKNYVETGKVKYIVKDFPLGFHNMAKPAAAAANCVYSQLGDAAYFEMHDKIFANQNSMSEENFKAWATELGADAAEFETCINNPEILSEIDADLQEGQSNGVSGTPSFFINGKLIVGAQPYNVFEQAIEAVLE